MADQSPALVTELLADQPRPTFTDHRVDEVVIRKMLPGVVGWMQDNKHPVSERDLLEILSGALHHGEYDGYRLARFFNRWNPDTELIEVMEAHFSYRSQAHQELMRRWVADNREKVDGLLRTFPIGTQVSFRAKDGGVWEAGRVRSLRASDAQAVIERAGFFADDFCPVIDLEELTLASPVVAA